MKKRKIFPASLCLSYLKQERIGAFFLARNFAGVNFCVFNWLHCQWHELLLWETKNTGIIYRN